MDSIRTEIQPWTAESPQCRYHRHSLFGLQLLSIESVMALREGLITESDFNEVRQTFFRAQKIRGQYDFGILSAEEYQTQRNEFAREIKSLPDLGGKPILEIAAREYELRLKLRKQGSGRSVQGQEEEGYADTVLEISSSSMRSRETDNEADVEEKTHSRGNSNDQAVPDLLVPAQQTPSSGAIRTKPADTPFQQQHSGKSQFSSASAGDVIKSGIEQVGDTPIRYNIINHSDTFPAQRPSSPQVELLEKQCKSSGNIINYLSLKKAIPKQVSKLQWDHHDDVYADADETPTEVQNLVEEKDFQDAEVEGDYHDEDDGTFESASEGTASVVKSEVAANKKPRKTDSPEGSSTKSPRSSPSPSQFSTTNTNNDLGARTASESQSKPSVPLNLPDYGAKQRILKKGASNFTGMEVTEEALNLYQHMKIEHEYKWVTFELNPVKKLISISNYGDAGSTFEQFLQAFSPVRCCYAVFLFEVYKRGEKLHRPVFVNWCPDDTPVKQRMIYASNKDFFKSFLDGLATEVQATNLDDLEEDEIKQQVIKVTK